MPTPGLATGDTGFADSPRPAICGLVDLPSPDPDVFSCIAGLGAVIAVAAAEARSAAAMARVR